MNINLAEFLSEYNAELPESVRGGEVFKLTYSENLEHISFFADFPAFVPADDIFSFEKAVSEALKVDVIRLNCHYLFDYSMNYFGEIIKLMRRDVPVVNGFLEDAEVRLADDVMNIRIVHGGLDLLVKNDFCGKLSQYIYNMFSHRFSVKLDGDNSVSSDDFDNRLVEIRYERNDIAFERNMFRVRGDTVEIYPAYYRDHAIRVEFFGDEIDRISDFNPVTGSVNRVLNHVAIYPASHYVTTKDKMDKAILEIRQELEDQVKYFTDNNQLVEAQRLRQRTEYDMEMMAELGYCSGIENYSRIISDRPAGSAPMTLLDFFPDDFLLFVDESHVTLPQVRAMYNGDHARKDSLVKYGFRLPCAYDNRPLKFEEFEERIGQAVFVSATPGPYERERADQVVEQVIRPTGLLDPRVEVRPVTGQIDDLMDEIRARAARDERVLVTTLTKKMAEDLTEYLKNAGIRVRYMHSDVQTIERMEIIRSLRLGEFDVLVGINLLREGLDLPEVSLVAILDADKEGFLRSETSLIQTIGRAARNADGLVIMYADEITPSMRAAIDETERRRSIQDAYNQEHGIVPKTIIKGVREILEISKTAEEDTLRAHKKRKLTEQERAAEIAKLEKEMREASKMLEFEYAAVLRDRIIELRGEK